MEGGRRESGCRRRVGGKWAIFEAKSKVLVGIWDRRKKGGNDARPETRIFQRTYVLTIQCAYVSVQGAAFSRLDGEIEAQRVVVQVDSLEGELCGAVF